MDLIPEPSLKATAPEGKPLIPETNENVTVMVSVTGIDISAS